MKRTSLYQIHKELGAKMVEFAGWEMPVQYEGVRQEHLAVRSSAGLFDVSHMGEIEVRGPDALSFCQFITSNDAGRINDYQAQYTLICNFSGGVVDDVILYKFSDDNLLFCVNASNSEKVFEWVLEQKGNFDVELLDRSPDFSQLAIQGPLSEAILPETLSFSLSALKRFHFITATWNGTDLIVARTGYTGENGYEVFLPWDKGPDLWNRLFEAGGGQGLKPAGLGARDTLRLEMGYSLYGHEIGEDTNPLEAGLARYVKLDAGDFIGRQALTESLARGLENKLVGFCMTDRGIPRQGYGIFKNTEFLGRVTSGTFSPSLEKPIGMGYLKGVENGSGAGDVGDIIEIEIRNTFRGAQVVALPFYKKG
jgi:aminomethyltransferase